MCQPSECREKLPFLLSSNDARTYPATFMKHSTCINCCECSNKESAVIISNIYESSSIPHLLVVEDEQDIRRMVSQYLRKTGYAVSSVESAEAAYSMLESNSYDAIVADVMLPGQDGIELLGRVHRIWPETPVILMTGYAQLQMAINAVKNGAFDFIHKPFELDQLLKIINRAIEYTKLNRIEKKYRDELEETVSSRTLELKNAMIELDYLRTELLRVTSEKNNFMTNISHEMRTPMNGVIGALDLLADGTLVGTQAEYLEMARQAANNMLAMINQLLMFKSVANLASGTSACYDLIDLKYFLDACIARIQDRYIDKGLYLKLRIANDVPGKIWIDKEQLSRLLEILLDNALKFTETGGALLEVSRVESANGGVLLEFSLTDSGIGIPEGMLERIFEPFVRVDGSLTRSCRGTGLGLSIARQYVQHLNGKLRVEQVDSGGSRFVVTLGVVDLQT